MESGAVDNFLRVAERLGLPAALIFAGILMAWQFVKSVGPAISNFLSGLTAKLESHTIEHVKLSGQIDAHTEKVTGTLDTHHAKTAAEIQRSTASIRSAVDSMRAELVRSVDAAADRILDNVLRPEDKAAVPRSRRIEDEETKESPR